jgi:hypothetical protein
VRPTAEKRCDGHHRNADSRKLAVNPLFGKPVFR